MRGVNANLVELNSKRKGSTAGRKNGCDRV